MKKGKVYKCSKCGLRIIRPIEGNCPICGHEIVEEKLSEKMDNTNNLSTEHF